MKATQICMVGSILGLISAVVSSSGTITLISLPKLNTQMLEILAEVLAYTVCGGFTLLLIAFLLFQSGSGGASGIKRRIPTVARKAAVVAAVLTFIIFGVLFATAGVIQGGPAYHGTLPGHYYYWMHGQAVEVGKDVMTVRNISLSVIAGVVSAASYICAFILCRQSAISSS